MIRGSAFYAVWDEKEKVWATDQETVIRLIDNELREFSKTAGNDKVTVTVKYMRDADSGSIDRWLKFVQKQQEDHWTPLDEKLIFSNTDVKRTDYSSHRLSYPLEEGDHSAFDELLDVLYSPEEKDKILWAIGSIVSGDSTKNQKFMVLTGDAGTGKSTIMKIIRQLFDGYTATIDAKAIGSPQGTFALEALKTNPLVAIQDDADLSHITDNTRLNSIVSHEPLMANEKYKSIYEISYRCFVFLGSNDDVRITDSRSGLQRRLIDVRPTGKTFTIDKYLDLMRRIQFESSGIAYYCMMFYKANKHKYDKYKPVISMRNTNPFYDFLEEHYKDYEHGVTLKRAWADYQSYCDEGGIMYRLNKNEVKRELAPYFKKFRPEYCENGIHKRNWYEQIRPEKFGLEPLEIGGEDTVASWIDFNSTESQIDKLYSDYPAQYANEEGSPTCKWVNCKTKLKDVDTTKLHWFKLPENIIKVDFDKKDKDGNKSLEENLKEANKFPKTYAEVSKSGCGIHLYYIYDGDPDTLSRIYDENIEVKVSTGNNSHRRILTKCNDLSIAHISSGLPLKEGKKVESDAPVTAKGLRTTIKRCLAKEIHADTRSNIDWIEAILDKAYNSGIAYDASGMKDEIMDFARHATNQSEICIRKVENMKFKSKDYADALLKGEGAVFDEKVVNEESVIRARIRNYIHEARNGGDKKEAIEKIRDTLLELYTAGVTYDISDLHQEVLILAIDAKDESGKAVELVNDIKFSSDNGGIQTYKYDPNEPIIFFDYEVFPNLVLLCWKYAGDNQPVMKVFNPTKADIEEFLGLNREYRTKVMGFNNKGYDNHITYALLNEYPTYSVFQISQGIINKQKSAQFREAKHLSYSDLLDFLPEKIGLKKWEIKLGIPHKENPLPWDQPVDEKDWPMLAEYCTNDVLATEAVFNANQSAWKCRLILCDLANILVGPGSTLNDSTNDLTTRLIVGDEKNPQKYFNYPDLSKEFPGYEYCATGIDKNRYVSKDVIITGKSIYRGYDPGEGGFVWANHGMWGKSEAQDSASHHPSTIRAKDGFGKFTPNFNRLLDLRLMIKHKEYDKLRSMYNGALAKYLENEDEAKALSYALKIAANSVYGLTAAKFPNRLRDGRNIDNWVAKRGALFMIDLMLNVQEMGYTVIHCKTDSIKVLNPDDNVRNYIREYGKKFGYTFETEHVFDRLCLVNDAVYVCKFTDDESNGDEKGQWSATGKQFQVPYVFKTLFSKEPIEFKDLCEMRSASTALYLDMDEDLPEGEHNYQFIGKTGLFCPIKPGCGGGRLLREKDGKYNYSEGAKNYRWLEADVVKALGKEADIDLSFYTKQVDKAVETISKFGDFEAFVSDGPFFDTSFMNVPETDDDEVPFEEN